MNVSKKYSRKSALTKIVSQSCIESVSSGGPVSSTIKSYKDLNVFPEMYG
jgi:hypothetical protein